MVILESSSGSNYVIKVTKFSSKSDKILKRSKAIINEFRSAMIEFLKFISNDILIRFYYRNYSILMCDAPMGKCQFVESIETGSGTTIKLVLIK